MAERGADSEFSGGSGRPFTVRVVRLGPYAPAFVEHQRAVDAVHAELPEVAAVVERHLGEPGRMISASKHRYTDRYPQRLVVFNANLLVGRRKVWWGDLDLTQETPRLRALARELRYELHVLSENDGRFQGRDEQPLVDRYIYWTDGRRQRLGEWLHPSYEIRRARPWRRKNES